MYGSLNFPVSENLCAFWDRCTLKKFGSQVACKICVLFFKNSFCMHKKAAVAAVAGNQLTSGRVIKIFFVKLFCRNLHLAFEVCLCVCVLNKDACWFIRQLLRMMNARQRDLVGSCCWCWRFWWWPHNYKNTHDNVIYFLSRRAVRTVSNTHTIFLFTHDNNMKMIYAISWRIHSHAFIYFFLPTHLIFVIFLKS